MAQGSDLCSAAAAAAAVEVAVAVVIVEQWRLAYDQDTTHSHSPGAGVESEREYHSHLPGAEAESEREYTLPGLHPSLPPLSSSVPKPSLGYCPPSRPHRHSHPHWTPKSAPRLSAATFPSLSAPDSPGERTTRRPHRPTHPSRRPPSAGHSPKHRLSQPTPPQWRFPSVRCPSGGWAGGLGPRQGNEARQGNDGRAYAAVRSSGCPHPGGCTSRC